MSLYVTNMNREKWLASLDYISKYGSIDNQFWNVHLLPGLVQIPVSMYQTVVTSLAQGNRPVQVAMAPVATRIDSTMTLDGQAVEVVTLEQ